MRVLMICPELPSSDKPGTMAPGARQIQSIQQAGVETVVCDMRGIPKLKYLQMIPRIRRAARSVDLIHAHFGYCGWLALIGRLLAFRRIPIVMSFMGSDLLGTPYNEQGDIEFLSRVEVKCNVAMAHRYDQIIVKSTELRERISHVTSHLIPNGVDLQTFKPMDRRRACEHIKLDSDRLNVLFPGNPENPRKGHQLASAAVKVAEQQLNRSINLVPLWRVKPDDVAVYMNACQAMLMTSVFEGSPNVVKEAMACNLCVIAVPVGDVHELLDGVVGCFRTSRDPNEVGRALAGILKAGRQSNGREILQQRELSLEGVAKRVIAVYHQALSEYGQISQPARITTW
jgi:glycosyltransferase involved in cell wall biosynthesis